MKSLFSFKKTLLTVKNELLIGCLQVTKHNYFRTTALTKKNRFFCLTLVIMVLASCSSRQSPAPVVDIKTKTPLKQQIKSNINATNYVVKAGETLYSIAWRADVDVRELAKINQITSPYKIFPGQKIFFVEKAAKPRRNKPSTESFHNDRQKTVKKPVAHNKKQAYGGNVSTDKVDSNQKIHIKKLDSNQKVRRWQWPAKGKVIKAYSTAKQGNKGIDISGRRGDAIKAAANGKVVYAGSALRGYGQLIIVKHNDDYLSAYAHNDRLLVKEQQVVKAGQVIAKMGDTGAKRVMLHFEVRFRGKSVNPMKYLPKK